MVMLIELSGDACSLSENERQLALCLSGGGSRAAWCLLELSGDGGTMSEWETTCIVLKWWW
jgi:hypothetical protein